MGSFVFSWFFKYVDRTHFDAPEIRREDVNDIFGKANVL